jgi:molybdopterin biosynthesis enzyme
LDLVARWNGVLHVRTEALVRLNTIDSLELFTLFQGQPVQAGQVVASVKVAPHLISELTVRQGVAVALDSAPLVSVWPYLSLEVAAIVTEAVSGEGLARFEAGARTKVEALGSRFLGTTTITLPEAGQSEAEIRGALDMLALKRRLPIILVGGVSAGDPLSPFYAALDSLGGQVLRHGVPAHPGSMIWLAELGDTRLLGLPQCGMFTLATAADLILPRLLTGERLTARELAELAHGGVLTRDMRFRFPPYAQNLDAPEG